MPATLARPSLSSVDEIDAFGFETSHGWMAVGFTDRELYSLTFGHATLAQLAKVAKQWKADLAGSDSGFPVWVTQLTESLKKFADGNAVDFIDVPVATAHLTPFATRVANECRKLEWGHVCTYADLAQRAGRPGAARAVGNVMATNRYPLVVPCHRVVGSGGGLGGYSAPGGLTTKRRLLEVEGSL